MPSVCALGCISVHASLCRLHSKYTPLDTRRFLQGFYIITYALSIYNLNLVLGFVTPQTDPELDGPTLPSQQEDEFRPFQRRLPEFKFW